MRFKCLLLVLVAILFPVAGQAGDYTYTTNSDNTITITGYTGTNSIEILPETIEGLSVARIGTDAFRDASLINVSIPNSITNIERWAFIGCSGLTNIAVAASHPVYSCTNGVLFNKNRTTLVLFPTAKAGHYTVPDYAANIGEWAFFDCTNLIVVIISDSVTNIEAGAFGDCYALTSVTIGTNVTGIGEGAFAWCRSLLTIAIPDSVSYLGQGAFLGCYQLTNAVVGNGVTNLKQAFDTCYTLTSVIIGTNVSSIGFGAFWACHQLTSITIPDSVRYIGEQAFYACYQLTNVVIGNGVTNLGNSAFAHCTNLTSIVIPDSATSVGASAFQYCTSLINVTIGSSVTIIGGYAFNSCPSLTSVIIGRNVTNIGYEAFGSCENLSGVYFQGNAPVVLGVDAYSHKVHVFSGGETVYYCRGTSGWGATLGGRPTVSIPYIYTIDHGTATITKYTGTNSAVDIPRTFGFLPVVLIGDQAFCFYTTLTNITIPINITSIGNDAFYDCRNLTSVTIGNSVTNIGSGAFDSCIRLSSVVIPNSVTAIGEWAFYDCRSLNNVVIGNGVTNIGTYAFWQCRSLTGAYFWGNAPTYGSDVFTGANTATVYRLSSATGWPPVPDLWASCPTDLFFPASLTKTSAVVPGLDTAPIGVLNIGDVVEYTLRARNNGPLPLINLRVFDGLPFQLAYVANSTKLNGVMVPDACFGSETPFPLDGDPAEYRIPSLPSHAEAEITYRCQIRCPGIVANYASLGEGSDQLSATDIFSTFTLVSISNAIVNEGNSGSTDMVFTVTIANVAVGDVSVDFATSDGTATAGSDYVATNGTLTILAGETTGFIVVKVIGDTNPEPSETLFMTLTNATGDIVILVGQSTGTIVNAIMPADADADGIPDSWEQQYFGNPTNANPNAICSNGVNTVRQAYIAGLNPNDPQSALRASAPSNGKVLDWNTVSGRVYSVYWTTNLMNGFQCLESNIPWIRSSFTNQATVPCGYYKIDVRMAD